MGTPEGARPIAEVGALPLARYLRVLGDLTRLAVIEALPLEHAASPQDAAALIAEAAFTRNPHDRYRSGLRDRLNTRMLTILPTSVADRIKTRLVGMDRGPADR
jgi:hypothetical protein